uniref:Protein YIP n=1 Tax=Blastobotrys adeninivorans TaxID=409370 RepID=A0A060TAI2_BLAAD
MSYAHVPENENDDFLITDDNVIENDEIVQDTVNEPSYGTRGAVFSEPATTAQYGSERLEQRRFMGGDTLDEPVLTTLLRDVKAVGMRLRQVVWRSASDDDLVENSPTLQWDLWGPLVFCLLISTTLSMIAPAHQKSLVFSGLFTIMWLGQVVVALNIKLLGGSISFFHALCVTGYSLFPLVIAAILSAFINYRLIRLPIDTVLVAWSVYATTTGLKHSGVLPTRVWLATYPVGLLFVGLGWVCVVS